MKSEKKSSLSIQAKSSLLFCSSTLIRFLSPGEQIDHLPESFHPLIMVCSGSPQIVLICAAICSTQAWPIFNFFGLKSGSDSSEETADTSRHFNPFPVSSEEEFIESLEPSIRIQKNRVGKDLSQARILFPANDMDPDLDVDPDQAVSIAVRHQFW